MAFIAILLAFAVILLLAFAVILVPLDAILVTLIVTLMTLAARLVTLIVMLGPDPSITVSPYSWPSSHSSVVRAAAESSSSTW